MLQKDLDVKTLGQIAKTAALLTPAPFKCGFAFLCIKRSTLFPTP